MARNSIATKARWAWLCALTLGALAQAGAWAAPVGTVTDISGPLLVRKADGTVKVLTQKSTVDAGDTLVSEKDTYARVKFVDNSEITLRPNTQFKIENFSYDDAKPEKDNAIFSLIKGGLRSITGLLGKRNHDRFSLNTPTATIGIRGTTFIAEYLPPTTSQVSAYQAASLAALDSTWSDPNAPRTDAPRDFLPKGVLKTWQLAQSAGGNPDGRNPGLYVQVLDGVIFLTNGGGTQNFTAGQFGFTPGFQQPPVILPSNPGIIFLPPASFSALTGLPGSSGTPGEVDCVVR
jgi:hypothetical protein